MGMPEPRVSVVVPTFNRRDLLSEALESIWSQTFDDYEVIVVDDGSTDGTCDYLEGLDRPRLRALYREHQGVAAAVNAGIRAARGELVARLDSDDLWLPDMLEKEVAALDARPGAAFVYARMRFMDGESGRLGRRTGMAPRFPSQLYKSLVYEDCTTSCTFVARRHLLLEVGLFDETLPSSEDWGPVPSAGSRPGVRLPRSRDCAVPASRRQHHQPTLGRTVGAGVQLTAARAGSRLPRPGFAA